MGKFLYFAYGSNMLSERLQASNRCPSAQPLVVAKVDGCVLKFCKRSMDKSGKATLRLGEGTAYGVVFEIDEADQPALDRAEGRGKGYDLIEEHSVVELNGGGQLKVRTYFASEDAIDESLAPYDWYHALVVAGAMQHELPNAYRKMIVETQTLADEDLERNPRLAALEVLAKSGYADLMKSV